MVQLASGCYWHKCKFCDVALDYIGRYAAPDPKQAVDAMLAMRDSTGVYSFHFTDEAIPPSLCKGIAEKFFASDDAPCKISRSVLHEYLSGQKYADEPYATAARFWFKSCTRMDVLEAVSAVCTKKFGNKINQVDGMDASRLYMAIVKFIPPDKG